MINTQIPDHYLTSEELSQQLKDAGAKQQSAYGGDPNRFLIHELLERLPEQIKVKGLCRHLMLEKYRVGFGAYYLHTGLLKCTTGYQRGDAPAEALGKLYHWCLENGHCKE